MGKIILASLAASVTALFAATGFGATGSVNSSADTFLSASHPDTNYGAAGALQVSASAAANGASDSIMMFNLAPVKSALDSSLGVGDWQITSVSLQLTSASPNNPIFNANAVGQVSVTWMQNDTWIEGTGSPKSSQTNGITYSQLSSYQSAADQSLGDISAPGTDSGANSFLLSAGSGLVNDILTGSMATLLLAPGDSTDSYLFNSNNFTDPTERPLLTVTAGAVPEPAASSLLAAGAVLLMKRCRRR